MDTLVKNISSKKVKAATLLEVMVGLVIICMVFAMVTMLYTQMLGSTLSMKKYKAIQLLQQEAMLMKKEQRWDKEEYGLDQYTIIKTTESWNHCAYVKVLMLEAIDAQGKSIAIRKELVYLP